MESRDMNTLTAVGGTSINGGAPPSLFGAYTIVYVHCGRRMWSTDRAGDDCDMWSSK